MDVKKRWIDLLGLVHLWKGKCPGGEHSKNKGPPQRKEQL
jgi:hypothetical protein